MWLNLGAVAKEGRGPAVTDGLLRAVNVVRSRVPGVVLGDSKSQSCLSIEISIVRNSLPGSPGSGLL